MSAARWVGHGVAAAAAVSDRMLFPKDMRQPKLEAAVSVFLTVGFSYFNYPGRGRAKSI